MSVAINVRNIEASSIIGTPLSSENSNTVIGLIKRVYNLLSGFVSRITTRIEAIESVVESITPGIGSLETAIQNINSNVTNLESSIQTVNSNVASNANRITTVESTVGSIGPRVSSLETAVQNTNSNVTNLESSIQTVNSNVASNANRITTVENTVGSISPRINNLETAVQNTNSNVANLESSIQTVNSNVVSNTNRISSLETSKRAFYPFYYNTASSPLLDFEYRIQAWIPLAIIDKSSGEAYRWGTYGKTTLVTIRSGRYSSNYSYQITYNGVNYYCYKLSFSFNLEDLSVTNVYTGIIRVIIRIGGEPTDGSIPAQSFYTYGQLDTNAKNKGPLGFLKNVNNGRTFTTSMSILNYTDADIGVTYKCLIIAGFSGTENVFNFTPNQYVIHIDGDFYTDLNYDDFISRLV